MFGVADIVHEVGGARDSAECDERRDRVEPRLRLVESTREHQTREHEDVLRPLARPKRRDDDRRRAPVHVRAARRQEPPV